MRPSSVKAAALRGLGIRTAGSGRASQTGAGSDPMVRPRPRDQLRLRPRSDEASQATPRMSVTKTRVSPPPIPAWGTPRAP